MQVTIDGVVYSNVRTITIVDSVATATTPAITTDMLTQVEQPKAKRQYRKRKAAAIATEPQAAVETQTATAVAEPKQRRGRRRRSESSNWRKIPLTDCYGMCQYQGKKKSFIAAIYSMGVTNDKTWYQLMFITKDEQYAFHEDGCWLAVPSKVSNIVVF